MEEKSTECGRKQFPWNLLAETQQCNAVDGLGTPRLTYLQASYGGKLWWCWEGLWAARVFEGCIVKCSINFVILLFTIVLYWCLLSWWLMLIHVVLFFFFFFTFFFLFRHKAKEWYSCDLLMHDYSSSSSKFFFMKQCGLLCVGFLT